MESYSEQKNNYKQVEVEQMQFNEEQEKEILRIMSQYLQEKGYKESAKMLEKESGVHLEGQAIQHFRNLVLEGQFDEAAKL